MKKCGHGSYQKINYRFISPAFGLSPWHTIRYTNTQLCIPTQFSCLCLARACQFDSPSLNSPTHRPPSLPTHTQRLPAHPLIHTVCQYTHSPRNLLVDPLKPVFASLAKHVCTRPPTQPGARRTTHRSRTCSPPSRLPLRRRALPRLPKHAANNTSTPGSLRGNGTLLP